MSQPQSITVSLVGRPCVVPDPRRLPPVARLANSFWCPLGPAVGRGWVLMLRRDLDDIAREAVVEHELVFQSERAGQPPRRAVFAKLLMVKSERLTPGAADNPDSLHLVELADKRLLVSRFSDTGSLQLNLRAFAQSADYLTGTGGQTWSTAVAALWNTMSTVLGTFPGLPAGYTPDGVPENLQFVGVNAWRALNQVVGKLGCAVAYDPIGDTFRIVLLGSQQSDLPDAIDADAEKLWDGEPQEHAATQFPETIRLWFHNHYRSYGQERDTEPDSNWAVSGQAQSVDVATAVSGARPGTVLSLWDDLPQVLDEDGAVENSAALSARAAQRASNWINDQTVGGRVHRVFPQIIDDVRPGAQVKAVLWRALGPAAGGTATEIISHPGLPREVTGGTDLSEGIVWDTQSFSGESFAPPDLARHSRPVYPRLPNIVQVDDGASSTGALTSANVDGLFPGKVVRWVAGAIATLEDCWIRPVDVALPATPSETLVTKLMQKDRFVGRLSGVETSGGDTRPIYLVRSGEERKVLWGKATENDQPASGGLCAHVQVQPVTDCDGATAKTGDEGAVLDVYLPERAGNAIQVSTSDVIAYVRTGSGEHVCVSDYTKNMTFSVRADTGTDQPIDDGDVLDLEGTGAFWPAAGPVGVVTRTVASDKVQFSVDDSVARQIALTADGGTQDGDATVAIDNHANNNTLGLEAGTGITLTGDNAGGKLKITAGAQAVAWAVCQSDWEYSGTYPGTGCPFVSVKQCDDCDGSNPTGTAFDVLLPRNAEGDPNLVTGDVIAYVETPDSTPGSEIYLCVIAYMDQKVGSVMQWTGAAAAIRPGWAVMDGSANSALNGGSEIDMVDHFVRGKSGTTAANDTPVGSDTHNHGGTIGAGTGLIASGTTGIGIPDHDAHKHPVQATVNVEAGVADTEVWDGDPAINRSTAAASISAHVVLDTGHVHSAGAHTHPILASNDPNDLPTHKALHFIERIDNSA